MVSNNLNIPIYLNQKIVFDMLATIENGFTQMSNIQTFSENKDTREAQVDAKIGTSNVFALFGISLKAAMRNENSIGENQTTNEERVHTPVSLFQRLRSYLEEEGQIKRTSEVTNFISSINTGDFIELSGSLLKNPLISLLETFISMMELSIIFTDDSKKNQNKDKNKKIIDQMKALYENLKQGEMIDLICEDENNMKTVLPTYLSYFFNNNMNEIIEGKYKILGKVSKVVNTESEEINLLRNTSFSVFQKSILKDMFSSFAELEKFGFNSIEISTTVNGPALMVVPIAIYL
ncbi:DUF6414 family protein [Acetobacterium malicum]|uniref:DUF6414 family protein n=1 Tax=Acetobacterium malicum TaxID=52692 RepID=UPI0035944430